ncbi:MAG TPA: hemerythrin domain-containing protein, partial [bacterium]|nr:hemerythrin domain-containing protein [bacterium]
AAYAGSINPKERTLSPSTASPSLKNLSRIHRELGGLFHRHQEALLSGDLARARALFQDYEAALRSHTREEDEVLIPLYRERALPPPRGGSPEYFTGEHQKINEWLGRLRLRLSRLTGGAKGSRALLALLDDEAFFKRYLEHHSLREDRVFYPVLDRLLTPRERTGLARLLSFTLEDQDLSEADPS